MVIELHLLQYPPPSITSLGAGHAGFSGSYLRSGTLRGGLEVCPRPETHSVRSGHADLVGDGPVALDWDFATLKFPKKILPPLILFPESCYFGWRLLGPS